MGREKVKSEWINTEEDVIKWAKKNDISPKDVYHYAYDIYNVMVRTGIDDDSIGREAIFSWATKQLQEYGVKYEDISNAWLSGVPIPSEESKIDTYAESKNESEDEDEEER